MTELPAGEHNGSCRTGNHGGTRNHSGPNPEAE
jgi:hypothetical protein